MANLKRPELKPGENMSEHLKNFELRFHDYCIQADHRNVAKTSKQRERITTRNHCLKYRRSGDRRGPHPWKPVVSVELTTTPQDSVLRQAPRNKNNHGKLPNGKLRAGFEATEHLAAGPNRTSVWAKHTSAAHDKSPTSCGILHWWLPRTMLLRGNTANTQCPHRPRKEKVLCYSAHVCNWEQFHPNDIPDRHRRHLQYHIWRCPSQADAKHEAYKVTLPTCISLKYAEGGKSSIGLRGPHKSILKKNDTLKCGLWAIFSCCIAKIFNHGQFRLDFGRSLAVGTFQLLVS